MPSYATSWDHCGTVGSRTHNLQTGVVLVQVENTENIYIVQNWCSPLCFDVFRVLGFVLSPWKAPEISGKVFHPCKDSIS